LLNQHLDTVGYPGFNLQSDITVARHCLTGEQEDQLFNFWYRFSLYRRSNIEMRDVDNQIGNRDGQRK